MSNLDRLQKSMVKILRDKGDTAGSGFIIREDGYLITCHHVIYQLESLWVEYQGNKYQAQWCEEYSNPDVDIAILKIDIENAQAVKIINPPELATSIIVYGFPPTKAKNFPEGFDVGAKEINFSAPLNVLSTYPSREVKFANPWNKLPSEEATFKSHRLKVKVERGTSGGAVFAKDLDGVVGVIQCSKSDESYVIRWDNILETLDQLGLNPEKNAVCRFLEAIEQRFKYLKLFHVRQQIALEDQYIPIEVTLERRYKHEIESIRSYLESDLEFKRAYALKGREEETKQVQVDWKEAKKEHKRIMVLGDPGMGKSTLLKMEAVTIAKEEKEKLLPVCNRCQSEVEKVPLIKGDLGGSNLNNIILPLLIRLSELGRKEREIIDLIPELIRRDYSNTGLEIEELLREKLETGKCILLLDALDEVPKEQRLDLQARLNRFLKHYPCPIICTSRIVGYGGSFVDGAKEMETAHIWEYDWHETLTLVAGLLSDTVPFLKAIIRGKDDIFKTRLLLAGLCLAECHQLTSPPSPVMGEEESQIHILNVQIVKEIYQFWLSYREANFISSTLVTLVKSGNREAVKVFSAALHNLNLSNTSAWELKKIGNSKALPTLITALKDSDKQVRINAASALGKIGDREAVPDLISALKDSNEDVRKTAASVLGQIGDREAVPALITALKDSDEDVRKTAASALGKIGNTEAVPALITALKDSDEEVKIEAAEALGEIGDREAVPALITLTRVGF